MASTSGQMAEGTVGTGKIAKCTVRAFLRGWTGRDMMVGMSMMRGADKAHFAGLMDASTLVNGSTENNTEKAYTSIGMVKSGRAFGKTEKE